MTNTRQRSSIVDRERRLRHLGRGHGLAWHQKRLLLQRARPHLLAIREPPPRHRRRRLPAIHAALRRQSASRHALRALEQPIQLHLRRELQLAHLARLFRRELHRLPLRFHVHSLLPRLQLSERLGLFLPERHYGV